MKSILITGCSRGLGLVITKTLLNNQYNVYGIARSFSKELQSLKEIYPNNFFFKDVDLSNINDLKKTIFSDFLPKKLKLTGYVNNAASAYDDIVTNINVNQLIQMYNVNVFSPMVITKYAIRNMLLNKTSGSIVHISSISAHTGYKGLSMYASTKGAIEAFSKNVAREWGHLKIRSNVVVPGFMETLMSGTLTLEQRQKIYSRTALKEPTDIISVSETVMFLLSESSVSITGQNIHVDSGTI